MVVRLRHFCALAAVFLMLLTMVPVRTAQAANDPLTDAQALALLQEYNIVRGDPSGNVGLDQRLTRAQAAALFVRVMGMENAAKQFADSVPFTDAVGHWAAGEIAMASRLGLMKGDGNGTFRPESDITYAEVLTVLLRIVQREPSGAWDPSVIWATAYGLGIAPSGVQYSSQAIRGKIFWSLAQAISTVPLQNGQTVLQKYVDMVPPTIQLDRTASSSTDSTVTITGVTSGAVKVLVNDNPATLTTATGRFTYTTPIVVGVTTFQVVAYDLAGNTATAAFAAERKPLVSRIEITGPNIIRAGTSARLTVKAFGPSNQEVPADSMQATLTGDVATFNTATQTLTAGDKLGRGVLTLQIGSVRQSFTFDVTNLSPRASALSFVSINSGRAPGLNKDVTVQVKVLDENGQLAADDYWRPVTLTASGLSGVTITQRTVTTVAGVATFTVNGQTEGLATLTASSSGLDSVDQGIQFLGSPRVVLTSSVSPLRPDGTTSARISATLQDDAGRSVTNTTGRDINVTLTAVGTDGYLTDNLLTIRQGYSNSSGNDAYFKAGLLTGSVTLSGVASGTVSYPVQNLTLPVTGDKPPVKIQVVTTPNNQLPGSVQTVTVQLLDSNNQVVTWGSYAFRLALSTSNNDPLTNGIPTGVTLRFSDGSEGPADGSTIVGRTYQGKAQLTLTYSKSGTVTITPKAVGASDSAYNPTIGSGAAAALTGVTPVPAQITFAGTPSAIKLTVDSTIGTDQPGGAVKGTGTMRIRARVVDSSGSPIPNYNGQVTLTRTTVGNKITRFTNAPTADNFRLSFTNGVAEFPIQSTGAVGFDVYSAAISNVSLPASTITVAVRSDKTFTPDITAIRGVAEGNPSPVVGYVGPDDDYMDIQLGRLVSPNETEPTYWVSAKVFRKGESSPFYTGFVDMSAPLPIVRIPKGNVKSGSYTYEVSINDGGGDTGRSPDLGLSSAVSATYNPAYKLNSGLYDAESTTLTLSVSGLASTGLLDTSKLSIKKDTDELNLGSSDVTVQSISSTSAVLKLNGLAASLNPDVFNGAVTIVTESGWYTSSDRVQVASGSNTATLGPLGTITQGKIDYGAKKLYLYGKGFKKEWLNLALVKIGTVALRPGTTSTTDVASSVTDGVITISLSTATLDAIKGLSGAESMITADAGWLWVKPSGSTITYKAPAVPTPRPLYVFVTVNSAGYDRAANTLTIWGTGFDGATVDAGKLLFRLPSSTTNRHLTSGSTAAVVNDTTIVVTLADADASYFESTSGFSGRQVLLNTEAGWLIDALQRPAAPISPDRVVFEVRAN
jgi:hypothetical protein